MIISYSYMYTATAVHSLDGQLSENTPLMQTTITTTTSYKIQIVHLLIMLFGISTWLGINSTFVESPLLVETVPEKWSLPSYIVIIVQIGNLGPILYTAMQKWRPFNDSSLIMVLLIMGCIASSSFAFLHNQTAVIFGNERSITIFSMVFVFALVGCTSSVLFLPYVGRFKEMYMITYLIGEGLSGLIPSVVALIQGVNKITICDTKTNSTEPNVDVTFGIESYFIFVSSIFVASTIGFFYLNFHHEFKSEYVTTDELPPLPNHESQTEKSINTISKKKSLILLVTLGFVCSLMNGITPR